MFEWTSLLKDKLWKKLIYIVLIWIRIIWRTLGFIDFFKKIILIKVIGIISNWISIEICLYLIKRIKYFLIKKKLLGNLVDYFKQKFSSNLLLQMDQIKLHLNFLKKNKIKSLKQV